MRRVLGLWWARKGSPRRPGPRRARTPLRFDGHGPTLLPVVIGPDELPVLLRPEEAAQDLDRASIPAAVEEALQVDDLDAITRAGPALLGAHDPDTGRH